MVFNSVRERILRNKEMVRKGIQLNIPYPFPRINDYLIGIDKGSAIGILGPTGSGKSKFVRYVFLYNVYKFYKQTGYKIRIPYFCMEDAKEKVMTFIICHYLKELYNISITKHELESKGREVPDFVIDKINEAEGYFNEFESIVHFIDDVTEPTEMFNLCQKLALKWGEVKPYLNVIEGVEVKQSKYESDIHVIAIFDNMSNIDGEDGVSNEQQAILKFCKQYMRLRLCKFFNWTCVMVMQMDFESERQTFTKGGDSIVAKLEPGLHSIGDSKRSSRSFHLIFSLFAPARYELLRYPVVSAANIDKSYDIGILGNRFRSLKVIKSNDTDYGMKTGLLFDGISESFSELPKPDDSEMKEIYSKIRNTGEKFVKSNKILIFENNQQDDDESPF